MPSPLERRYGRLLLAYPAGYRRARGPELVGTLLEASRPGQRWPSAADAVDLLAGGIRHRLGLSTVPGLAGGWALAAPLALALAAGIGGYYLVAELNAASSALAPATYRGFGPFATIGPVVYLAWLLAAAGRAALPRLASRWLIGLAIATTAAVVPLATLAQRTRPILPLLVPLALLGLIALVGSRHTPSRAERAGVAVGTAAATGALSVLVHWYLAGVEYVGWGDTTSVAEDRAFASLGASTLSVLALALLALIGALVLVGCLHAVRPPRDTRALWAAALLLVPGLPLVVRLASGLNGGLYNASSVLPAGLAAGCLVLAVAVRSAGRRDAAPRTGEPAEPAPRLAGTLALGAAVAICGYAWLAGSSRYGGPGPDPGAITTFLSWPVAALASAVLPGRGTRVAIALAVGVTVALPDPADPLHHFGGPAGLTLVALGAVAFAGLPATRPRRPAAHLAGVALAALLAFAVCAVPAWAQTGAATLPHYLPLAAVAPCAVGLVAGGQALRGRGARRMRGAAVLLASGGWFALTLPDFSASPWRAVTLLGALLCVPIVAALLARGPHTARTCV